MHRSGPTRSLSVPALVPRTGPTFQARKWGLGCFPCQAARHAVAVKAGARTHTTSDSKILCQAVQRAEWRISKCSFKEQEKRAKLPGFGGKGRAFQQVMSVPECWACPRCKDGVGDVQTFKIVTPLPLSSLLFSPNNILHGTTVYTKRQN